MKTLRPDQSDAIEKLRTAIAGGKRRIMMQGATGYGKTMVAASIIERSRARGNKVLMTVPALSLVDQTVEALYEQGLDEVGVIQANHERTDWSKPIQVASVQTLMRRDKLPEAAVVLIDEAHVWFKFYEKLLLDPERRNIPVIGLSATPWSRGLGCYYEELIIAGTTGDLIENGILSKFKVFAPSHPDLKGVRTIAGDYHEGELAERMNKAKLVADIVSTWKAKGEGRPTICFAVNRAHAKAISEQFEANGIGAGYMDCETPPQERREIRRRFLQGEHKVVCNVDVIGMGVDWPEVSCVIYARPTKSEMRVVQNIGRALRVAPGKTDTIILDHSDTSLRLGLVTDIHHEELDNGKVKENGKAVAPLPKECPQCTYLKPPRCAVCPNCGFKSEVASKVETKAGELKELGKRTKAQRQFTDKRATYGQLLHYARSKGYKDGWAANKYRAIFDVWPRGLDDAPLYAPTMELASWIRGQQIRYVKGREKGNGYARPADPHALTPRQEKIIEGVRERFMPGTLCTERDFEDFR